MGAFLDKPKTEKHSEHGCGNGLSYGVSSMQGWRIEMEDAHCAIVGLPHGLKDWSFFAVFDGHAGDGVSAHCAENLLNTIIQAEDFRNCANCNGQVTAEEVELVKKGIRDGFLRLDERMRKIPQIASGEDKSGSTAVCALVSATHFYFANCGDSRAVLSRDSKSFFSTQDHKPINPTEKERIQKAGGSVMIQRVNGSLAVSRALGDYEYKQVEGRGPCEQLVSPEPEVTVQERDNELDEFLVLACDGVWDVMSNDELCEYIRHMLHITSDLEYICSSVIDACFYKGSKDNMSIVIVALPGAPTISEGAVQRDKELNRTLERRLTEILAERETTELNEIMHILAEDDLHGLPPGGGLWSKRSYLEDLWVRLKKSAPDENFNVLTGHKGLKKKIKKDGGLLLKKFVPKMPNSKPAMILLDTWTCNSSIKNAQASAYGSESSDDECIGNDETDCSDSVKSPGTVKKGKKRSEDEEQQQQEDAEDICENVENGAHHTSAEGTEPKCKKARTRCALLGSCVPAEGAEDKKDDDDEREKNDSFTS